MKKILLLLLATYWLNANDLPQRIETTIKNITSTDKIELASSVPEGMSGIVIHNYGNGLSAITHTIITQKNGIAKVLPYSAILHENIPTVKTSVEIKDKIILGNFYNNALLITPDAKSYANITKRFKKTWIHPDAYAMDLMKNSEAGISLSSLHKFAKLNQVGLVLITTQNTLLVLDPISKRFLGELPYSGKSTKAMKPFFSRFEQMDVSVFGLSEVKIKEYYQAIKDLK